MEGRKMKNKKMKMKNFIPVFYLKDNHNQVIANMSFTLNLLWVTGSEGQKCADMEHHLKERLEDIENSRM
jgi:hypothetical protein